MLGIVELIATSDDGRNPLKALEACRDEISPEFLKRLANRPETVVLLQCSCRLGCSGGCDCSRAPQGGMSAGIWTKFDRESYESIWRETERSPSEGRECSCDGLPRVTDDLVASCRTLKPYVGYGCLMEEPEILSSLLDCEYWWVKSNPKEIIRSNMSNISQEMLSNSKPCLAVLSAIQDLLDSAMSSCPLIQEKIDLPAFGLDLMNYLILNLATQRSFGCLTAYLPKNPEQLAAYLGSKNPLKLLLAELVFMRREIAEDLDGKKVSAFCIDLANMACQSLLPPHYRSKRMSSVGQAMIFATLFGGTVPKVTGGGGGIGLRSGRGGCLEVKGYNLMDYLEVVMWPSIDQFRIHPQAMYQIRSGGIYTRGGRRKFWGMTLPQLGGDRAWFRRIFEFKDRRLPGSIRPSDQALDVLDRMEDLYEYRKASSEGWRELLSYHPWIHDEIERPRVFDRPRTEATLLNYNRFKRYFNRLPEDDDMKGQRALISSRLIPKGPTLGMIIPFFCRVFNDDDTPVIAEELREWVIKRLSPLLWRSDGGDDEMLLEAKGVQDRLEQIIEEFSLDSESDVGKLLVNSAAATRACDDLLTDLDDLALRNELRHQSRSISKSSDLFSANSAKHYSLSNRGVKILSNDQCLGIRTYQ